MGRCDLKKVEVVLQGSIWLCLVTNSKSCGRWSVRGWSALLWITYRRVLGEVDRLRLYSYRAGLLQKLPKYRQCEYFLSSLRKVKVCQRSPPHQHINAKPHDQLWRRLLLISVCINKCHRWVESLISTRVLRVTLPLSKWSHLTVCLITATFGFAINVEQSWKYVTEFAFAFVENKIRFYCYTVKSKPSFGECFRWFWCETKTGWYLFWLFFEVGLCSAIPIKRSRRELSIDVADHRSILKIKEEVRVLLIFQDRLCSGISFKRSRRELPIDEAEHRSMFKNDQNTH